MEKTAFSDARQNAIGAEYEEGCGKRLAGVGAEARLKRVWIAS